MIRSSDVWVRRGDLVKPDSMKPYDGLAQSRGLTGTHRGPGKVVRVSGLMGLV